MSNVIEEAFSEFRLGTKRAATILRAAMETATDDEAYIIRNALGALSRATLEVMSGMPTELGGEQK